nr:hypothetical protein [Tanacetum cinerariifolium]
MQNLHDGPPGEDKEHEATTDTELPSTENIQPLLDQEPPREFDIHQLIEECSTETLIITVISSASDTYFPDCLDWCSGSNERIFYVIKRFLKTRKKKKEEHSCLLSNR